MTFVCEGFVLAREERVQRRQQVNMIYRYLLLDHRHMGQLLQEVG